MSSVAAPDDGDPLLKLQAEQEAIANTEADRLLSLLSSAIPPASTPYAISSNPGATMGRAIDQFRQAASAPNVASGSTTAPLGGVIGVYTGPQVIASERVRPGDVGGELATQFGAAPGPTAVYTDEEKRVAQERGLLLMTLRSEFDRAEYEPRHVVQMIPTAPHVTWRMALDARLDDHAVFVHERHFILLSKTTWDTMSADQPAMREVIENLTTGSVGMKFLPMTDGPYGRCVRAAGATTGAGRVVAKDRITILEELIEALALQAQQLNAQGGPSSPQMQNFAVRLAELNVLYREEEIRLGKLRGLLDLAGAAVLE